MRLCVITHASPSQQPAKGHSRSFSTQHPAFLQKGFKGNEGLGVLMKVKVTQSCPTLCSLMAYTIHLVFSKPEYWSGQPFLSPGDLSNPGIETKSPTLQMDFFLPAEPQRKPKNTGVLIEGKKEKNFTQLLSVSHFTQFSPWRTKFPELSHFIIYSLRQFRNKKPLPLMWCINQVQKYKGDLIKYSDDQEIKAERSNLMRNTVLLLQYRLLGHNYDYTPC